MNYTINLIETDNIKQSGEVSVTSKKINFNGPLKTSKVLLNDIEMPFDVKIIAPITIDLSGDDDNFFETIRDVSFQLSKRDNKYIQKINKLLSDGISINIEDSEFKNYCSALKDIFNNALFISGGAGVDSDSQNKILNNIANIPDNIKKYIKSVFESDWYSIKDGILEIKKFESVNLSEKNLSGMSGKEEITGGEQFLKELLLLIETKKAQSLMPQEDVVPTDMVMAAAMFAKNMGTESASIKNKDMISEIYGFFYKGVTNYNFIKKDLSQFEIGDQSTKINDLYDLLNNISFTSKKIELKTKITDEIKNKMLAIVKGVEIILKQNYESSIKTNIIDLELNDINVETLVSESEITLNAEPLMNLIKEKFVDKFINDASKIIKAVKQEKKNDSINKILDFKNSLGTKDVIEINLVFQNLIKLYALTKSLDENERLTTEISNIKDIDSIIKSMFYKNNVLSQDPMKEKIIEFSKNYNLLNSELKFLNIKEYNKLFNKLKKSLEFIVKIKDDKMQPNEDYIRFYNVFKDFAEFYINFTEVVNYKKPYTNLNKTMKKFEDSYVKIASQIDTGTSITKLIEDVNANEFNTTYQTEFVFNLKNEDESPSFDKLTLNNNINLTIDSNSELKTSDASIDIKIKPDYINLNESVLSISRYLAPKTNLPQNIVQKRKEVIQYGSTNLSNLEQNIGDLKKYYFIFFKILKAFFNKVHSFNKLIQTIQYISNTLLSVYNNPRYKDANLSGEGEKEINAFLISENSALLAAQMQGFESDSEGIEFTGSQTNSIKSLLLKKSQIKSEILNLWEDINYSNNLFKFRKTTKIEGLNISNDEFTTSIIKLNTGKLFGTEDIKINTMRIMSTMIGSSESYETGNTIKLKMELK